MAHFEKHISSSIITIKSYACFLQAFNRTSLRAAHDTGWAPLTTYLSYYPPTHSHRPKITASPLRVCLRVCLARAPLSESLEQLYFLSLTRDPAQNYNADPIWYLWHASASLCNLSGWRPEYKTPRVSPGLFGTEPLIPVPTERAWGSRSNKWQGTFALLKTELVRTFPLIPRGSESDEMFKRQNVVENAHDKVGINSLSLCTSHDARSDADNRTPRGTFSNLKDARGKQTATLFLLECFRVDENEPLNQSCFWITLLGSLHFFISMKTIQPGITKSLL